MTPSRIADLKDRIQDMGAHDDWRRRERLRDLYGEEDAAREFARDIRNLQAKIERARPDQPSDKRCWNDIVDLLSDAATTADQIVSCARAKSTDVSNGVEE